MKTLIIAPHPDDEILGCGGYIAKQKSDDVVQVLYMTSGERGIPGTEPEDAADIRRKEALAVSGYMGFEIVGFWDLPDGQLRYLQDTVNRLATLIDTLRPDTVLVTHEREGHPDHRLAGIMVRAAKDICEHKPEFFGYEVWTPLQRTERVINITEQLQKKMAGMVLYQSQLERNKFDVAALSLARYRGIMQGRCEYAEAFGRIRSNGVENLNITIVLLTWAPNVNSPRHEYAKKTLESVLTHVNPGPHNLQIHIADDGSGPDHVETLIRICKNHGFEPSVTNAERGGYGRSYNLATNHVHERSDLIMPIEDDWELSKPLNLEPLARAIEDSKGEIKCIRLGYIGFTADLRGKFVWHGGNLYMLLDPNSPEVHVFAGHPRLETVEFERSIGTWPEGISAGATEWDVAHRWDSRVGVVWPVDLSIPASQEVGGALFGHIGTVTTHSLEGVA